MTDLVASSMQGKYTAKRPRVRVTHASNAVWWTQVNGYWQRMGESFTALMEGEPS